MEKKRNVFYKIYIGLLLAFFYLPIAYVVLFSFNSSKSLTNFESFSLKWYEKMFNNSTMMEAIYYTVIIAVIATIVSTIVGTITAIGLSKSNRVIKELVTQVNNLPMLNPDIVTAVGLMLFFTSVNIDTGFGTLLLAHIMFCIPYVMLSVTPRLRQMDDNLAEAALDLGCTPFQALYKVIIPEIKQGIISGMLIAFTMSFDDFVISYFVTGPGINNISIYVYSSVRRLNPTINALSTLIVVTITIILVIVNVIPMINSRRKAKKNEEAV
jgi:spermidine/putrescine transport system permease protein